MAQTSLTVDFATRQITLSQGLRAARQRERMGSQSPRAFEPAICITLRNCKTRSLDMRKVLAVFDTRPEAIKMAPLIHRRRSSPDFAAMNIAICGCRRNINLAAK